MDSEDNIEPNRSSEERSERRGGTMSDCDDPHNESEENSRDGTDNSEEDRGVDEGYRRSEDEERGNEATEERGNEATDDDSQRGRDGRMRDEEEGGDVGYERRERFNRQTESKGDRRGTARNNRGRTKKRLTVSSTGMERQDLGGRSMKKMKRRAVSEPTHGRLRLQQDERNGDGNDLTNFIDNLYVEHSSFIRVKHLKKPVTEESFDWTHYEFVKALMSNGYKATRGMIVVYIDPDDIDFNLRKSRMNNFSEAEHITEKFEPVDGVFRTLYIKEHYKPEAVITVLVLQRRDGKKIDEDELLLYAARRNGTSSQNKALKTANLFKIATRAVQLLDRRQQDVGTKPISWFQTQICDVLGYPNSKRSALRGLAEIAKNCVGRVRVSDSVGDIMEVTPRIGVSHLTINEDVFEDIHLVEIYLLTLRKAFHPSRRGPQISEGDNDNRIYGDSQLLTDTSKVKGVVIKAMSDRQGVVLEEIRQILDVLTSLEDNGVRTVRDILRMDVRMVLQGSGCFETGGKKDLTVSNRGMSVSNRYFPVTSSHVGDRTYYPLKDVITDAVSEWFEDRTTDRMSAFLELLKTWVKDCVGEDFSEAEEDYDAKVKEISATFSPFIMEKKKKSVPIRLNQSEQVESLSRYDSEDLLSSSANRCEKQTEETGEREMEPPDNDTSQPQRQASTRDLLMSRLEAIRKGVRDREERLSDIAGRDSSGTTDRNAQDSVPGSRLRTSSEQEHSQSNAMRNLYDDIVPDTRPVGALSNDAVEMVNAAIPGKGKDELLKISTHSSLWKTPSLKTAGMDKWIDSLYLKEGHRASMFVTHALLEQMHNEMHTHLAHVFVTSNEVGKILRNEPFDDKKMDGVFSYMQVSELRQRLRNRGWITVPSCPFLKTPVQEVDTFFKNQPLEADGEAFWELIADKPEESANIEALKKKGSGRRQTSRYAMMELMETSEDMVWKQRAKLDVYIALLARTLELGKRSNGGWDLQIPATGGRELASDPRTLDQALHCDFSPILNARGIPTEQPGYFAMISGDAGFFIWIVDHSQYLEQQKTSRADGIEARKVFIKPFSIFIARGDVYHAGAAYDERTNANGTLRYHILLSPSKEVFNEIHYHTGDNVTWCEEE